MRGHVDVSSTSVTLLQPPIPLFHLLPLTENGGDGRGMEVSIALRHLGSQVEPQGGMEGTFAGLRLTREVEVGQRGALLGWGCSLPCILERHTHDVIFGRG